MKKHFTCANAALPTPPCNSHRTGTILSLALTLMLGWSANAWADDVTMPAGTYYFDCSLCTKSVTTIKVFGNISSESYITFNSEHACNNGITKNNPKEYKKDTGFSALVLELTTQYSQGGGFVEIQINGGWPGSKDYTKPHNVGTDVAKIFVCQFHDDGTYSWATSPSAIPSCDTPPTPPTDPCPNCKKITKQ